MMWLLNLGFAASAASGAEADAPPPHTALGALSSDAEYVGTHAPLTFTATGELGDD